MEGRERGWEARGSWTQQVKGVKDEDKGEFIEKRKIANARALTGPRVLVSKLSDHESIVQ